MNEPMVSVVIPAYNAAKYISEAIDSALRQDVPLEVIVIDDCSKDDLDSAMERYADDGRVNYIKNPQNVGVAKTRNRGVSLARGEYIAFLDADDSWAENKLKKQIDLLKQTGCVLCATGRELVDMESRPMGCVIGVKEKITYKELLKHNSINCSSVVMKTNVAKEFPMGRDEMHEDYITWLQILKKYGSACAVDEPLLKYRSGNQGKSGSKIKSAKMTYQVYKSLGVGPVKTAFYFLRYAVHGVAKYLFGYWKKK